MKKKIYFDMDGTIADLYNSPNWLSKIRNEKPVFENLPPMVDTRQLNNLLMALNSKGYELGVITWLPMDATQEYKRVCRKEKKTWIEKHFPILGKNFHAVQYGTPKHLVIREKNAILIDDNAEVRAKWEKYGGIAIDEKNILTHLEILYTLGT